jgi:hypothetical protein
MQLGRVLGLAPRNRCDRRHWRKQDADAAANLIQQRYKLSRVRDLRVGGDEVALRGNPAYGERTSKARPLEPGVRTLMVVRHGRTERGFPMGTMPQRRPPRRMIRLAASLGLMTAMLALSPASATAATPKDTGCPVGSQLLSLDFLREEGPYMAPFVHDAEGNGDGFVCGKPYNDVVFAIFCPDGCGGIPILYSFSDNDLTPEH